MKCIKIVSTPAGEAPEWVRQAWIGIVLPVAAPSKWLWRTVGVVSGSNPLKRLAALISPPKTAGYGVHSATAIAILEQTAPEAAQWWRDNAPRTLRADHIFVFHSTACDEFDL